MVVITDSINQRELNHCYFTRRPFLFSCLNSIIEMDKVEGVAIETWGNNCFIVKNN